MAVSFSGNKTGHNDIEVVTFSWTSNSSGAATVASPYPIEGLILRVIADPDGTAVPSNAYDVTLTDAEGLDVLSGLGANLSNTTTTHFCPGIALTDGTTTTTVPIAVNDVLTLNVTNAGDTKSGEVKLYVR